MSRPRPLVVEDVEHAQWDDAADLVVVGLGAAGVSAAIEACDQGAEVVVLERFEGGGAAAISGGVFYGNLCPVKTSYPTNEYHLYFSGNETVPPYSEHAAPAPRGHRTDGGAFPGANFIEPLRRTALAHGARFKLQARVNRLIVDRDGRVVGAEYCEMPSVLWRKVHAQLHRLETTVAKVAPAFAGRNRAGCDAIEAKHSVARRIRC